MKPYFDYFFISEHAGAAKPAPAFFDYAFRELNENRSVPILPQETLIIGDSLSSDIAGGLQYGMKTCYYRRPGAPAAPTGVDYTVTAISQIPALQGGAPRRDGLRPSPWLRHGPCGASHRQTYPHKKPTHVFPQVGFSFILLWQGDRPHPTSMEFRIFSNISHCVLMPSPISGVRVSRIIS